MATKLIHCKTYSTFNSKKLSAQVENTSYTVGVDGSRNTGTPEINYQDIVFIQDTAQIWTHGKLYENTTYSFSGGTNGFTVTSHNGSKSGEPTTVKVTPSIANASDAASGLMSKTDKTKLDGIASGAEVNVQSDWSVSDANSDAYIKNKPVIDSALDVTSVNAIQNKVVSASITGLINEIYDLSDRIDAMDGIVSADTDKLSGIQAGAEVNQNAFSNVKVGSTTIAADAKTDTLTLVAGSNITITPDATNDKITIAGNYSNASTSAAGLMSKEDKAKLDSIESGADSIVISKTSAGGKTTASFTVNGGTATTFDIYGITNAYNPTSTASDTNSLSQVGAQNLYNAVLSKAGGAMNENAIIKNTNGNLYIGDENNSNWVTFSDIQGWPTDLSGNIDSANGNSRWFICVDGSASFKSLSLSGSSSNVLLADGTAKPFTTSVTSGSTALVTSEGVYTKCENYLLKTGGTISGNLTITGELKAQGEKFYVNSQGAFWTSDKRFKDNISNARNLNIDSLIREFDWKDSGNHSWGFIAQELLEVLPEAVNYDEQADRYSVNYDVAHSAAIASLSAKIEQLESRIKELEK